MVLVHRNAIATQRCCCGTKCNDQKQRNKEANYFCWRPCARHMSPSSVYTDAGIRITNDIGDAGYSSLNSLFSVTCTFGCQYSNSNMPDVRASAMTASGSLFVRPLMADCTHSTSCRKAAAKASSYRTPTQTSEFQRLISEYAQRGHGNLISGLFPCRSPVHAPSEPMAF